MGNKSSQTGPGQTSLLIIKEADSDILFIAGTRKLMHWSVSQNKMTKDSGYIMTGSIYSMAQTSDKNYLFVSDNEGC